MEESEGQRPNDDLEDKYRSQIEEIVRSEANRILEEKLDLSEVSRLSSPVSYTHLTLPTICSV